MLENTLKTNHEWRINLTCCEIEALICRRNCTLYVHMYIKPHNTVVCIYRTNLYVFLIGKIPWGLKEQWPRGMQTLLEICGVENTRVLCH